MAKKQPEVTVTEESPYIEDAPKAKKSFKDILNSRGAKIGAIAAGSTLALGAAFGIGLVAGHAQGPDFGHEQFGQGQFDGRGGAFGKADGDHFGGHRDGDRDGDRRGKFDPNMPPPVDVGGGTQIGPVTPTP